MISLEDIAKELLGSIGINQEFEMIKQLSPCEYRLAGYLPIHDWVKRFGIKHKELNAATVSGFVAYLIGRIPQEGDVAHWNNLIFTVEQVSKHRIQSVRLNILPENQVDA